MPVDYAQPQLDMGGVSTLSSARNGYKAWPLVFCREFCDEGRRGRVDERRRQGFSIDIRWHHFTLSGRVTQMAGVAQLVRASGCGPECRGFESRRSPHMSGPYPESGILLTRQVIRTHDLVFRRSCVSWNRLRSTVQQFPNHASEILAAQPVPFFIHMQEICKVLGF